MHIDLHSKDKAVNHRKLKKKKASNTIEQSVKKSDALEWEDLKAEGCPFEVYSIDNTKYLT